MPECHSTNDLAAQIVEQPSAHDGTVIITDAQTKGRGQRGNQWITEAGKNLTFSMILYPSFIAPKDQFLLTCAISLGIYDLLLTRLNGKIFIKWPNDILVNDKKICGILIENQLRGNTIMHSVVGVGLNVNQKGFDIRTATSMCNIAHQEFALSSLLDELLHLIEIRYMMLRNGKGEVLKTDYHDAIYWKDETHTFSSGSEKFEGMIDGVDDNGRLSVVCGGIKRFYDNKQLVYLH